METCKGKYCPLVADTCLEHKCVFYQQLFGQHPQTGERIAEWDCAHRWQNLLLIELAGKTDQVGASVQTLRNETSQRTLEGVGRVLKAIGEKS